jgi:hypothetical protein
MITSTFFVLRLVAAWLAVHIALSIVFVQLFFRHEYFDAGVFVGLGFVLVPTIALGAFSHLRRVRLVANEVNSANLSSRQRRQIEVPFEAGEAFDLIDAAVRELPGAQLVESARDSLQVRAKVTRIDPYGDSFNAWVRYLFRRRHNQILVTVTPNGDAGSVRLICEPERSAWTDLFLVDFGTNLENAEAIGRAITRRVAERRRQEQVSSKMTVTEKELTVAKLSLLHAQVEPHFLYNTLASAQLLTRTDPARADEMLGNLILYLRHSLPRTEDALSTVGEELERARLPRHPQDSHGQPPAIADRGAARAQGDAVPDHDAANAGRERDQARPRTEAGRRHRVDPRARDRGRRGRHRRRRRQGL